MALQLCGAGTRRWPGPARPGRPADRPGVRGPSRPTAARPTGGGGPLAAQSAEPPLPVSPSVKTIISLNLLILGGLPEVTRRAG